MSTFVTQSLLGSWFGISARKIGNILKAHGLKDRNVATQEAIVGGYAKEATTRDGISFWVWDPIKVVPMLYEALGGVEKPFIDDLVVQVGEALTEANRQRDEGCDFLADLIEDEALAGVPSGLIVLIRARLKGAQRTEAKFEESLGMY